jgi:hypothetical protein
MGAETGCGASDFGDERRGLAPGATPGPRFGARPAESANRSARRARPDRGQAGAPNGWIPIGTVGAHRAAATKRTRSDRVRLWMLQQGRLAGSLARPHGEPCPAPTRSRAMRLHAIRVRRSLKARQLGSSGGTDGGRPASGTRSRPTEAARCTGSIPRHRFVGGCPANGRAHRKRPGRSRALRSV